MSPDPSVFDEQVREIEKRRPRRSFWKRPLGCVVALLVVALAVGAFWVWRNRGRVFGRGGELERLEERGRRIARTPPREMLEALRGDAAEIQDHWEELQKSGEIEKRLGALREKLAKRRDEAGQVAGDYWNDLLKQSDSLIAQAREKGDKVPDGLQRLVGSISRLEEAVKKSEGASAEGAQSEDKGAEKERIPRESAPQPSPSPGGMDYGVGR